jgi:hypothetical protein
MRVLSGILSILLLVQVAGCGGSDSATAPGGTVTITPSEVTVKAGESVRMTVRPPSAATLFPHVRPTNDPNGGLGGAVVQINSDGTMIFFAPRNVSGVYLLELKENDSRGVVRASATITIVP